MRKVILVGAVFFSATVLSAGNSITPLRVKTGLWQMTETRTWTGLPPQAAAMFKNGHAITYKSCVKPKDLNTIPWAEGSGDNCHWTVLNSTGTDMEANGTSCELGKEFGVTADAHVKIHVVDSEHGTGSADLTLTGSGITANGHATYTGKWVATTCPARMN